jgi:hypothetical protein
MTDTASTRVLYAGECPPGGPTDGDLAAELDDATVVRERGFLAARDRLDEAAVDCVVATHREDGFDGVALLETVRREYADLPVVLVPETGSGSVARRAVDAGVTAFVPATESDALAAVAGAVTEAVCRPDGTAGPRMPISDLTVAAERRLKEQALDEAPVGITISDAADPENPMIYMNDSFEDITGYPPEEALGVNHRFLQGPGTDPERVETLAAGIEERRDTRVVLRNYRRDGTPFWSQVDVSPILDDGDVTHYVGFQTDVTERERAKRDLESERAALDRVLDRVEGLGNDVTTALVRADDRETVERATTERVAAEYATAWLGRYHAPGDRVRVTERASGGEERDLGLDADRPWADALRAAVEDRAVTPVADPGGLPDAGDTDACVLVPLTYRSTTYGVLGVVGDGAFADERERVLLGTLGRTVGASINDVLTKRTLSTDTVIDVTVELVDAGATLQTVATDLGCTLEHEALLAGDGSDDTLAVFSTDRADAGAVVATAEAVGGVRSAETLVADDDGCVVELRLAGVALVDALTEVGGRVTAMTVDGTGTEVECRVGSEYAARRFVDTLEAAYGQVELAAYREATPDGTARGFREDVRDRLTGRQLTALQKAYASGFFEWPREASGERLADSMDIVPSTYHQHLQAAERKLVGAFFEE